MQFGRIDHIAIEVEDFVGRIAQLVSTGALRVIRYGTTGGGKRLAMLGDGTGMKIEIVECMGAKEPRFLHFAFLSEDIDGACRTLVEQGWTPKFGPAALPAAKAYTAMLTDGAGLDVQVIHYDPSSPDAAQWQTD
jgi:hypothetical protein